MMKDEQVGPRHNIGRCWRVGYLMKGAIWVALVVLAGIFGVVAGIVGAKASGVSGALMWTHMLGWALTMILGVLNVLQWISGHHLRSTFEAEMCSVYNACACAFHAAQALRRDTSNLAEGGEEGIGEKGKRKLYIHAGQTEYAVRTMTEAVRGFVERYLNVALPTWKDLVARFDDKARE